MKKYLVIGMAAGITALSIAAGGAVLAGNDDNPVACVDERTAKQVDRLWSNYDKDAARHRDDIDSDGEADGEFIGRYTGKAISLKNKNIDMDHVVARNYARQHGGKKWSCDRIKTFVNDPRNLVATFDKENRRKSDKGPSEYMPERWQCSFAQTWRDIAREYDIKLERADRETIAETETTCATGERPRSEADDASGLIHRSRTGKVCYEPGHPSYERYDARTYETMEACLADDKGRRAKS